MQTIPQQIVIDCTNLTTREINQKLKALAASESIPAKLLNPAGRHNLAVGITQIAIAIDGPVGYYCGGLSDNVNIEVFGDCGWSVGENLMSGNITIHGNASANTAASAHGGKICILGNAGPRAGISLKGATLIVSGNVGYGSAFMMQQGCMIVCGDAGANLADSIYEGAIFVGGEINSLGADAKLEPMNDTDWQLLEQELSALNISARDYNFKKVICAKQLYHFKAKDWGNY
ncbi:protein glxC [Gloeocapsopsis sp. IPPAS B-1203]|uniref:GltB/FmdC/FwdC-like GXGXG domain-containing protein n=1 Tax=Gloeocapsopsis sp. IPPAS B-1203 TaxID=2049454 RepID=UPI000C17FCE2|nr:protein glxC [Gloeocapsopsis sp. IPPAS B-1203]PIG93128.1 protein glxC [Gloeocapsopsis sp. IPPAS B-1203]